MRKFHQIGRAKHGSSKNVGDHNNFVCLLYEQNYLYCRVNGETAICVFPDFDNNPMLSDINDIFEIVKPLISTFYSFFFFTEEIKFSFRMMILLIALN